MRESGGTFRVSARAGMRRSRMRMVRTLKPLSTKVGGTVYNVMVSIPLTGSTRKQGGDPTCPHCRGSVCDWEHILWRCPHYRTAAGALSRPIRAAWQEARGEPRCLWTLGHVPKGWAPDPSSAQMCQQHSLRVGVYDPNGPKVRGGTDGGAVKTATGMRAGFGVALTGPELGGLYQAKDRRPSGPRSRPWQSL